jgi:hypothetical protein
MTTSRFPDQPQPVPGVGRTRPAAMGHIMSPDEFRDLTNNRRVALSSALQHIADQKTHVDADGVVKMAETFHSFLNGGIITTSDGQAISTS